MISGASGSGKSTLLALLTGILRPKSGDIHYQNTDITHLSNTELDHFRGNHISIMFQNFHLIPVINVIDNITLGLSLCGKTVDHDHLQDILTRLDLIDIMHQRVNQLSIGEQQRTALARTLITRPQWIFCDEPTSALDDSNTSNTLALLEQEAKNCGASLITVTHDARVRNHFAHHHQHHMEGIA